MADTNNVAQYTEEAVGAGHPSKTQVIDRHSTACHDDFGRHKWVDGGNVASASSISIPDDANYFTVTGTTTITAIAATTAGSTAIDTGVVVKVKFSGALSLTHNATSFIMPQGQNLSITAGDFCEFIHLGSGNWACLSYSGFATTDQAYRRRMNINGDGAVMQGSAYDLSGVAASTYGYGPDMWEAAWSGTTCTSCTFTNTTAAPNGRTGNACHFVDITLTGTGVLYARTKVESKDAKHLKNTSAIFSVNVQHDVGSAINVTASVYKANSADNFSATTLIQAGTAVSVSSGTATDVSVSVADMGDCSNGIMVLLTIEAGAVTTKAVYITEAQIEEGTVATPYEWRDYATELAKCKRYLPSHTLDNGSYASTGLCYDTTAAMFTMPFDAQPRIVPTGATISGTLVATTPAGASAGGSAAYNSATGLTQGALAVTGASGLTAGNASLLHNLTGSDVTIIWTGARL